MIEPGEGENPQSIKKNGSADRQPTPADEENQDEGKLHREECDGADPIDALAQILRRAVAVIGQENPGIDGLTKTERTG